MLSCKSHYHGIAKLKGVYALSAMAVVRSMVITAGETKFSQCTPPSSTFVLNMKPSLIRVFGALLILGSSFPAFVHAEVATQRIPVVISGGHETDPRDHGRPVVLVAGGLGVTPEVFRQTFSGVRPVAPGSYPDQGRAQQNKSVLLASLSRYGVTNERLDKVSDYYRYQPGTGRLWPTKPASIIAKVKSGEVISFEVIDGGSGYTSVPSLSVAGAKCPPVTVRLRYVEDLRSNGSIGSVTIR